MDAPGSDAAGDNNRPPSTATFGGGPCCAPAAADSSVVAVVIVRQRPTFLCLAEAAAFAKAFLVVKERGPNDDGLCCAPCCSGAKVEEQDRKRGIKRGRFTLH